MSVVMMDNSELSAHADVRDEWMLARQAVLTLVAALSDGDPESICDPGHWEFPYTDAPFTPVLTVFAITEDELLAECQRQYDAWEQESSDD